MDGRQYKPKINIAQFEEEINKKLESSLIKLEEKPEENLKNILFNKVDKKYLTESLIDKTLEVYNIFNLAENAGSINTIKLIFSEALNFSEYNFSQRIIDFYDYILSYPTLKFEKIKKALKEKNDEKEKNKDIIFFWKQKIAEEKLKEEKIIITEQMKECLKSLIDLKFNLNKIIYIFNLFKEVINNDKSTQYDYIIKSLISTLILYPNFLNEKDAKKRKQKEDDLKSFMKKYIIKFNNQYIFDEKKNIALDFYLKISSDKSYSESSELTVPEIFQHLKINNPEISEMQINKMSKQLEIIESTKNDLRYRNYELSNFKNWTKNTLPVIKQQNSEDKITAIILGMISLAVKKHRGYFLRNTQIIAVLLFIAKEQKKGLIEEISTGEGKSCIISTLSIYFALMEHKVDIIPSSYTLAQRDSDEFKDLYNYFNLTTDYPSNSQVEPYNANILYGTFLEFEGDYLREVTSDMKIRNERAYDVIIIDEVDNLFIDNILGSTRLTNSSLGFKFLTPLYLTIYLYFELFDYVFLLYFKIYLDKVEDDKKRKRFEELIKNPKERKKEMLNVIQNNLDEIFKCQEIIQNEDDNIDINKDIQENENFKKIEKANKDFIEFFLNLSKFMEFPDFLKSFVENESQYWLDSAYNAKNLMELDRDYVEIINKKGHRDIAPVDRSNTGEIELDTVYGEGLHQMLEIKHKLRVKDQTLVHTFLSHITFFQKYKKTERFLFFGLTGTIGDKETQKIYSNDYYDSKLLFMPQYKKKRFVELPPLLVDIKNHFFIICKDILINFYKGRKILVICYSIKEAKIIQNELINRIQVEQLGIDPLSIAKEDFRDSIILYTRSDTEKGNIKIKEKRIILSTNLGGRGTDIPTTEKEEDAGGLHVILTYMPKNYRVLKQAFGRTSREGKKGTGQIILKNVGYNSYTDVVKEMNDNEKEEIQAIQKRLRILLFKDKLFEDFIKLVKDVDFNGYLIDDINERWANFLRDNITSVGDELDIEKVEKKFKILKKEIEEVLSIEQSAKVFKNPFYQMKEGLRKYQYYQNQLSEYYNFKSKINKFYFAQPYIQAIIIITNAREYNKKFFKDVKAYFDETIKRIKLLIDENLNPVLNSFDQWEAALANFESTLKTGENIEFFTDLEKPFTDKSFMVSDLFKQYTNIKKICLRILERIEDNKKFMDIFEKEYKKNNECSIIITQEDLEDGLSLTEEEIKEVPFFHDATFNTVFKFSIKRKKRYFEALFWLYVLIGVICFLAGFSGIIAGLVALAFVSYQAVQIRKGFQKGKEIGTDSLFGNIFFIIIKSIDKDKNKNKVAISQDGNKRNLINSNKNVLFDTIMANIETKFDKIKTSSEILKFLIFIDYYYSEEIWTEKIKTIFESNFDKIYKIDFNANSYFKTPITDATFDNHLINYDNIFQKYLDACIKDINNLGNPKKFNKKEGLNCLEHLIQDLNSDKITEDMSNKTVQKILGYNLLSMNGEINKKLFKDIFKDNNGNKLEQKIKIHFINKIEGGNIKEIKKLEEFKINGFEIPLVNSAFIDLANFYQINGYDINQQLEKDFSSFIVLSLKQIMTKLLTMDPMVLEKFYSYSLNYIKELIKNLLQEKIFSKYNQNTFENAIAAELTKEEKAEFSKMIKEATENAANLFKNNK